MQYDEGAVGCRFEVSGGEGEVIIKVVGCGEDFLEFSRPRFRACWRYPVGGWLEWSAMGGMGRYKSH